MSVEEKVRIKLSGVVVDLNFFVVAFYNLGYISNTIVAEPYIISIGNFGKG